VPHEREPEIVTAAPTRLSEPQPSGEPGRPLAEHGPLDDARFAPGHIFASRYRIVSLLGRGAMGEAYRAEDLKLGQPVAVKLLGVGGARRSHVQRFISEVRLARTISHPNVCRVYDIGEADGWWYVPMELVDGETLASLLRRIGRLPAEKALDIARQLCAGLAAAHDRGVLHRDLKPSNIMVDGRGRIRIMDFGLALPSGEWTIGEIAGTPAYMAPEQMAGERVTEQTDVYALGLVLYELYAGRRLFPVRTFEERQSVSRSQSIAPALPGTDPEIERLIHACLDDDPERRPASALAIAARLPGGDPLAAALAGGVVPSPEMVAAAGPKGALDPAPAWALLGAVLVGIVAIATQAHVMTVVPSDLPKPPDVLAERARNILTGVGADEVEVDSVFWFDVDASRTSPSALPGTESTAPGMERPTIAFVYRRGPRYLVAQNLFRFVTDTDPPADLPGMATVTLDPVGRLVRFTRVLEAASRAVVSAPEIEWAVLFGEAGLDAREFVAAEPDHTPRVPYDQRFAWRRTSASSGPRRVAAATLDGKAVQFDVVGVNDPAKAARNAFSTPSAAGEVVVWAALVSIFVGGALLARHNLRLGQGDRRGAGRLRVFVICAGTVSGILRAHHVPIAIQEITLMFGVIGWALVWGGFTWLMYVSLEPYVRRVWPRTLTSWTRLLSGYVRDPLVGRDALIGMLVGVLQVALVIARFQISGRAVPANSLITTLESMESIPHFTNIALAFHLLNALQFALAGAFLAVLIRLIVRKMWIAVGIGLLVGMPFVPGGAAAFGWELVFVVAALLLTFALFFRIGLLALFAMSVTGVLIRVPVTLDPNAWYFGHSLVVLLILAGMAAFAFLVSLGGRPVLGGRVVSA
jgi:serine/threonine-protein kinase